VVVAVTNRKKSQLPDRPRSRGLLARELLDCPTAAAAVEGATPALDSDPYAGCNFFCGDRDRAGVLQARSWLRGRPPPPGLHLMGNDDVNDATDPRIGYAMWWLHQRSYSQAEECVAALRELCGLCGHEAPHICIRGKERGTVSSSILVLRDTLASSMYLHA